MPWHTGCRTCQKRRNCVTINASRLLGTGAPPHAVGAFSVFFYLPLPLTQPEFISVLLGSKCWSDSETVLGCVFESPLSWNHEGLQTDVIWKESTQQLKIISLVLRLIQVTLFSLLLPLHSKPCSCSHSHFRLLVKVTENKMDEYGFPPRACVHALMGKSCFGSKRGWFLFLCHKEKEECMLWQVYTL